METDQMLGDRRDSTRAPAASSARLTRCRAGPDELAALLDRYVSRDGRSLNRIAQSALLDVGYLWRLRAGEKRRPSRDVLIRLALALKLEPEELDQLLVAVEYTPITLRSL
jgi:hypothetical protein